MPRLTTSRVRAEPAGSRIPALFVALLALIAAPTVSSGGSATDNAAAAMRRGDFETALNELRPAAERDPHAQFLLGMLYDAGKGVPQDFAIAASWYRKAARKDHLLAQLYLGMLCFTGDGVKQDYPEAARWLRPPANAGNDQAQFYLGWMHVDGKGVTKNDSLAILWLTRSATQQNTRAMGMLATQLFSRSRNERDLIDAYAWSHLAAEADPVQAALSTRGVIEKYCSAEQKQQGRKAMAEWKRKWAGGGRVR